MIYSLVRKAAFTILVRAGIRQVARKSVGLAREDLENRLPDKVIRVAEVLPGDMIAAGGAALVAVDGAKTVAKISKAAATGISTAGAGATDLARKARRVPGRVTSVRDQFVSEVAGAAEHDRRSMMSDFQRLNRGETAATDALLDHRHTAREPLANLAEPTKSGRRRFVAELPVAPVNRVQRSYRVATKAWDRSPRRKLTGDEH